MQLANDVEKELRTTVIQAVQVAPDKYRKFLLFKLFFLLPEFFYRVEDNKRHCEI